jgi:hypothetical protein
MYSRYRRRSRKVCSVGKLYRFARKLTVVPLEELRRLLPIPVFRRRHLPTLEVKCNICFLATNLSDD